MLQVDLELAPGEPQRETENPIALDEATQRKSGGVIAGAIVAVMRAEREREVRDEDVIER